MNNTLPKTENPNPATALKIGGAAIAASALISGCKVREQINAVRKPEAASFLPPPHTPNAELARTALTRLTFGATPGEWNRVCDMGVGGFIEEQLAGNLPEPAVLGWRVRTLDTQNEAESSPDTLENEPDSQLLAETQQAALLRAVYSKNGLRETLADFWTNHFNLYALKNNERSLIPVDAETVVRPHVFGKFRDLLFASSHSPAMLSYLDNQLNKKGVANENYARELLELHTLGVKSGYTLHDIQEVARCFTGWRVKGNFEGGLLPLTKASFTEKPMLYKFDRQIHDSNAKYIPFLNLHIAPNGGDKDAEHVLEALAVHPATAKFLATKLCKRFLGDAPEIIVNRAATAYLKNDTDIRALMRAILLDGIIGANPDTRKPLLKRPLDFLVSSLRAINADTDGGVNVQVFLANMGQPLYQWPMPDGYPEKEAAWTGSLLGRWNYALALTANKIKGTSVDFAPIFAARHAETMKQKCDALLETVLLTDVTNPRVQPLREVLHNHVKTAERTGTRGESTISEVATLIFASPDFQRR